MLNRLRHHSFITKGLSLLLALLLLANGTGVGLAMDIAATPDSHATAQAAHCHADAAKTNGAHDTVAEPDCCKHATCACDCVTQGIPGNTSFDLGAASLPASVYSITYALEIPSPALVHLLRPPIA